MLFSSIETDTAMNARESENFLPISRSFSASNGVEIFWAEIYRGRLNLGLKYIGDNILFWAESSLIQSNSRDLVISPPPFCTRVSKDTGSSSCERKIFRPSVYIFFLDISNISASFAGIIWKRQGNG
jgi:hypothetical protein